MNELALFAGAGGGILGGNILGWRTVCAVELNPYAAGVLIARQNDGILPPFPIWDDIRIFAGRPWRGFVDIVSGGFPCQDISPAGKKAGIDGEKSGLWREMYRIVCEVRPRYVYLENSSQLVGRGLARVLSDLATAGYDAKWLVLGASTLGAPHTRERLWLLAADANIHGQQKTPVCERPETQHSRPSRASRSLEPAVSESQSRRPVRRNGKPATAHKISQGRADNQRRIESHAQQWWSLEPGMGRVAHGVAHRLERIRALGNGQVPCVAAWAFYELKERLKTTTYSP